MLQREGKIFQRGWAKIYHLPKKHQKDTIFLDTVLPDHGGGGQEPPCGRPWLLASFDRYLLTRQGKMMIHRLEQTKMNRYYNKVIYFDNPRIRFTTILKTLTFFVSLMPFFGSTKIVKFYRPFHTQIWTS